MDQKFVRCMTSLKEEAEAARGGAPSSDLNSLIADVSDLCKQAVSEEDVSFAIAMVFDRENGIFNAVDLLMTIKERTVVKARESCCTLLAEFIEQIGDRALPHVAFVKEKCLNLFRRDESKVVQAAALSPLLSMIETNISTKNSSYFHVDWSLAEMLLQEYRKAKTSGTLRANILILLGYLVEYYPAAFDEGNVTVLLKICLDTLEEQLRQTNKDPLFVLVSGVMKCLDSLLTWYDDSLPAGGSVENAKQLYLFLQQVICYREDMKRYELVKAGLRLLSRHGGLFALRLAQDSKEILSWLQTYCTHTNALLRDAGFSAFNQFISQVSKCLVVEESRLQNAQGIYKHFMATFFGIIDAQYMDAKLLLSLAVRGLGRLAPAIVKFSGKDTLEQVFHRLRPFGGSTSKSGEDRDYLLGHSDTLIGAFADIVIHLDKVEDFMVSFIAEVTGNVFYQFPQLFPKQKKAAYITLSLLFKSLYLKGTVFSIFLTNIVWSSLERAMESTDNAGEVGLPLWPHYVELWSHLLDFTSERAGQGGVVDDIIGACSDNTELKVDQKLFQEFMFDTIIRCIMKVLTELNLKYRVRASDKHITSTSLPDDVEAAAVDPETAVDMIEPLDVVHMRKYLNLVEFIEDFLSRPYAHLFMKWVYPFGSCIMELSNKYPLISGHYKLLTVTIRNGDLEGFFPASSQTTSGAKSNGLSLKMREDWKSILTDNMQVETVRAVSSEQQELCKLLFQRYLQEVLVASKRYKLELLASCLRLCLSAPPALIDIGSLVVPIQTALKIGLRYPPLVSVAMDALECWLQLYPRELELCLPDIVRFLSNYLAEVENTELSETVPAADRSAELQGTSTGIVTPTNNLSWAQQARLRQSRAKANQPGQFEVSQLRVQRFLGQIGRFNHLLIPELDLLQVAGTGGLAWDSVDRVQFTLPFRDEKHDVWLDSLLPRVVELAISSTDRRTKVTASELLQALCLVMLGNSAKGPIRRKHEKTASVHLDKIYRRLFPAILRLAVDVELVTRQLFNEFAKQLIHWYTSNLQKENPETVALLDAILDGLVDAENGSLREFCADCFGEFLSWSVRHAPPEMNDFVNVKSILRRLYNRMDHPNPYTRLGAAMAAYRMYPVLRGSPSIVDRYIFELIFYCIKSLQLAESDDSQIGTFKQLSKTLDNFLKLVERNMGLLQRMRKDRPMFLTLEAFLEWLLQQTGLPQEKCRSRCMSALRFICQYLPVGSLAGWFRGRIKEGGSIDHIVDSFDFKLDSHLEMTEWSMDEAGHQLPHLIRSLHWFSWALKDGLITTKELQLNTKSSRVIKAFLQKIFRVTESSSQWDGLTPLQREAHQKLKCKAIIHLLEFIKHILDIEFGIKKTGVFISRDAAHVQVDIALLTELIPLSEPNFYEIMCLALLRPRDLGFVITDPRDAEELARLAVGVMQILTSFSSDFKLGLTKRLQALLRENKSKYDLSVMNLTLDDHGNIGGIGLEDATSLLKGYQQLHLAGSLQSVLGKEEGIRMGENLLMRVFEIGRECPPGLESIASEMLSLSLALGLRVQHLVELCLDEKIIISSLNARKVTAGGIFYLNFRKLIVRHVKFGFKDCQVTLLQAAVSNPTARLLLNAVLDDYIKSNERFSKGSFLTEILCHLKFFQPCSTSEASLADKQFLLEIFQKLLILDSDCNLLQDDQSAFRFFQETFISFISGFQNLDSNVSSSQKDSIFSLKSQSLVLVPFFLKTPFDNDFQSRLARVLTKLVSDHLLVQEADLQMNSNQRSSYLQLLSRLLEALSVSSSLVLLEVVFPLLLRPPKFVVKKISATLDQFSEGIGEGRMDAFDLCLRILNDDSKLPQLRRAVIEDVFVPLVKGAPEDFMVTWYSARIKKFVEMLGKPPSDTDAEKQEESLVVKICHYHIVEHLFLTVQGQLIKEKITPLVSNASLMKQTMSESRAKNDTGKLFPENSSLWRDLHISAYRCLGAIALRTQEQEKIFSILFKEGPAGMIWQHIIDTEKVYDSFPVETSQLNAVSQTVKDMRASHKKRAKSQGNVRGSMSTLSSQYFVGAGLSQEPALINTFVSNARDVKKAASLGMSLTVGDEGDETNSSSLNESQSVPEGAIDDMAIDQDDFDLHPCMPVVLRLIDGLHSKFGAMHRDMPEWMKGLLATFQSAATHLNIRLFLTKVVIKAWKVFAPHSQVWFLPLVQTILLDPAKSGGMCFHYILRDVCITLLQWKITKPPDSGVASSFINHLMTVAAHGSSPVLRANVDIIRLFLDSWKEDLQLEKRIIIRFLSAGGKTASASDRTLRMQRIVGLQLLGAVVASGLLMYDPLVDLFSEKDLYSALLQNLTFKGKEVYEAAGELLGMALKQQHEASVVGDAQTLETPLKQTLHGFIRESNLDCFLNVLNKITLRFPQYIKEFSTTVIDMLPKLHGIFKTIAVDIFLRFPSCVLSLLHMLITPLNKLLTHRDEVAQFKTLQLLMELVRDAPEKVIEKKVMDRVLPVLCETFATHENVDCRQQYYNILVAVFEKSGESSDKLIIQSLLVGLTDSADVIRLSLQSFWNNHLAQDLGDRFSQMISQMYDPSIEESWAQFSNVLLLKLCEDSVDYKRAIFNAPLSDCEFHEQTINTAWSGSSLPMTPLFSQSQNVPQPSQDGPSQVILPSQEKNALKEPGLIRATFTSTMSQTQASSMFASQESSLFAMARQSGTQRESSTQANFNDMVPRRRILQANAARSQIVRGVLNANRRREARVAQQATERGNKVQMMRRYRIGELPDIEIKYEEILAPLAALAEKDATFARQLLTLICRAVYTRPRGKDQEVKDLMKTGISKALEKTHNGISFIGCLQALCLEDSESWVPPKLVGPASLKSRNFHAGILVLENAILHENSSHIPASKRHKGVAGTMTTAPEKPNIDEAWLELAHLYNELGADDVVLSVYQKNLSKKDITHQALEAQLSGDPNRGLVLYDQALDAAEDQSGTDAEASQIEQDIWYNQRLVCLADLNRWGQIIADTLVQVQDEDSPEPDLQKLWHPSVQDPYLSLFIRGAVKVPSYMSKAAEFVQTSLEDPDKREVLMKQYGPQLATLAVVNNQLDRARFYISNCYRTFRKQWSTLHPLAIGARHHQVKNLQKTVELEECIDLMTSRQLQDLPRKLEQWRHRWPSSREDSVEAWDDIVQNRLVFFNKFQGLINNQFEGSTDDIKRGFASKLNEERAHMFNRAASSLTKQGAYNVAQKYMEEYNSTQQRSSNREKLDYKSIKGLVKLRCLQAKRVNLIDAAESSKMLNQVLGYVKSNAEKPEIGQNSEVQMGFKLLEAGVSFQLALSNLGSLPKTNPNPATVNESLSMLSSAYTAYSSIFSQQSSQSRESTPDANPKALQQLAKTSLKFGHFCNELLKLGKNTDWNAEFRDGIVHGDSLTGLPPASIYPTLIVKHMMKALSLDTSLQAQHGVARLLSLVSQHPETWEEFLDQVRGVPCWVFIPWIPQMLAVMDQEEGELLIGTLEEIARLHPQALYFAFHVSEKDFGPVGQTRTSTLAKLLKHRYLEGFVRALEDLTFPEQRLRDGLSQIKNYLAASDRKKAKTHFAEMAEDCLDPDAMSKPHRQAGEYNCKFARDWSKQVTKALGEDGGNLLHMDEKGFTVAVKDLITKLQKAAQNLQSGPISLTHLSKWIAKFVQSSSLATSKQPLQVIPSTSGIQTSAQTEDLIQIPGQYSGFCEPNDLHHVKLVGFDQTLLSLSSKQRPKVLTMRGSDEKEYKFVVKGGEDLRLDQRIEQLFEVMNSILQRDSVASRQGLSVRTYAVIPVSKSCGLLQFVENTCVLEDVVKDGLICKLPALAQEGKDAATGLLQKLRTQHHEWVTKRGGPAKASYESFTNLYKKVSSDDITQMLSSLQAQLPWDTFRAGVSRWATSAESYLALRSQLAKSLSVISICGYVAGVGDRHLANTLVDMRSGSLVPIDFGYSFGTGVILLPVPELIPFRLTTQLTNLLLPLDASGLLRTDMVHTLSALHASREVISAVMDVFVKEPLVDWKNEAMKTNNSRENNREQDEAGASEQKYVELKVENAQRKLQLWNPAAITVAELQSSIHANKPYLSALQGIVRGSPDRNVRARIRGNVCQSIGEQVDCLIDQATDPNLLGRIWTGWQAWV